MVKVVVRKHRGDDISIVHSQCTLVDNNVRILLHIRLLILRAHNKQVIIPLPLSLDIHVKKSL